MKSLTKTNLSLYLAVIFIAGAVTGGALGWRKAQSKPPTPTMDKVCMSCEDRLKARLNLTPEQITQIQPILEHTSQKIKNAHRRCIDEIDNWLRKRNEEIAKYLTPEQLDKLEEDDSLRREWMAKRQRGRDSASKPPADKRQPEAIDQLIQSRGRAEEPQ
jgi:Spy/CpxP family protein refolding chaperone